jgi:predicted N-acetyltransferase YhbS
MTGADIRPLRVHDLPEAACLSRSEHWNQTEADWARVLRHSCGHAFAAQRGGELAGTVTAVPYQTSVAWIGMMLVRREHRGCGIGRRLMQTVLESLHDARVRTVKLDATPAGQPLYASLGFAAEAIVHRMECILPAAAETARLTAPLPQTSPAVIADFDCKNFGADRRALLGELLRSDGIAQATAASGEGGVLRGFGLAREGARAAYLGPILAKDNAAALQVLDLLLARLAGRKVCLDLVHSETRNALLAARGFAPQRTLTRMSHGARSDAGLRDTVFASAGPELG